MGPTRSRCSPPGPGAPQGSCCACFFPPQLTDYINASFMDGYKQRNAYIGTQGTAPSPWGSHKGGYFAPDAHVGFTSLPSISHRLRRGIAREGGTAQQVSPTSGCMYASLGAFTLLPVPSQEGPELLLEEGQWVHHPSAASHKPGPGLSRPLPAAAMAAPSSCP